MVKISFIINSLGAGGAERVLVSLANYLATRDFTIHILTLSQKRQKSFYPLDKKISVQYLGNSTETITNPFSYGRRVIHKMLCLRQSIKDLQPQVIISFMDLTNIATLILTRGLKIPVIVAERNDPAFHKIPWIMRGLRLWYYSYAQSITVQTNSAAAYFPKFLQSKIKVIPNPVSTPLRVKKSKSLHHTIVTLGRLDPQKNHTTLIKAFAKVQTEFLDWKLLIYGQGPDQEKLERLIAQLNLQKSVTLASTTQDIWSVLTRADIFVFPSRYEGFPNALCEAMSVGLPVIASNVTGNKDVINNGINGFLFKAGNVDILANLIKDLIRHPEKRNRLGLEAQKITKQYPAEKVFKIWEEMIQNTVN